MITYHSIDSLTLMSAIEIIERNRWDSQNQNEQDRDMVSLALTSLRNVLKSDPMRTYDTSAVEHE